jgi:hypothetical protein
VELGVDRIGSFLPGVDAFPEPGEMLVVGVSAERAGSVPGRERGCLVEEEELGELAGLEEWAPMPSPELELARDPALAVETAPDPARVVVQAAAVPVNEATSRNRDELTEGRNPVLQQSGFSSLRLGLPDNRARAGAP